VNVLQSTLLYFIKYIAQREAESDLIMAVIFVTAIFALPFWEWTSRRWSKRWAYVGGIAFWAVVQIVMITVNASTGMPLILFLCVLAGIGVGAAHVIPWSIIPDAMEKVASSIAIPLALLLLEVTGYVPNAAQQPSSALWGIRFAIGPIPAALLCAGILFAINYPLSREQHAQVVRELESRRASQEV
jgi:Na+/melibiose symporter-like transporter